MVRMTWHEPVAQFKLIEENAKKIRKLDYWKQFRIDILAKYKVQGKLLSTVELLYSNVYPSPCLQQVLTFLCERRHL
jgi:hypothetical protein